MTQVLAPARLSNNPILLESYMFMDEYQDTAVTHMFATPHPHGRLSALCGGRGFCEHRHVHQLLARSSVHVQRSAIYRSACGSLDD